MATGQAAEQAAQRGGSEPHKDDDRGPGSVTGNLVRDIDLRYTTTSGRPVCNIRVAASARVRDAQTGQWKDGATDFYDIQCWGNLAENTAEYLRKGDRIVAEGRWKSEKWEDKDGVSQEKIILVARDLGPSMMFNGARIVRKGDNR